MGEFWALPYPSKNFFGISVTCSLAAIFASICQMPALLSMPQPPETISHQPHQIKIQSPAPPKMYHLNFHQSQTYPILPQSLGPSSRPSGPRSKSNTYYI